MGLMQAVNGVLNKGIEEELKQGLLAFNYLIIFLLIQNFYYNFGALIFLPKMHEFGIKSSYVVGSTRGSFEGIAPTFGRQKWDKAQLPIWEDFEDQMGRTVQNSTRLDSFSL